MKYTNRNTNANNATPLSEVPMQTLCEEVQRRLSGDEMVLIGAGDSITATQIEWLKHALLLLEGEADDCDCVCDCGCEGDCSECVNEYTEEDMNAHYTLGFNTGVDYVVEKLHALLNEVED